MKPNKKLKNKDDQASQWSVAVVEDFNNTTVSFPDDMVVQQLFEDQVKKRKEAVAVICDHDKFLGQSQITYQELNNMANQVARKLRILGIEPNQAVGLMVQRSYAMIVGILGILKAGGAYLPIAPGYPSERAKYILSDSGAKLLLVENETAGLIDFDCPQINLEDRSIYDGTARDPKIVNSPTDLAYIIYTSGSTGKPKGVMIEHRSLINRLHWMQNAYPINKDHTILQKTPFNFDVSVWELLWWAMQGAKMCFLMPGGEKIPFIIVEAIKKHQVNVLHFVPSMLNVFLEYLKLKDRDYIEQMSSLNQVFSSGEALTPSHVTKYNKILGKPTGAALTNLYGPTEATVDVTYYDCPTGEDIDKIYIGKPISNTKIHILKDGHEQPIGEAGELCISGIGLARGYVNNRSLTRSKFLPNPSNPSERIYKTGDVARWNSEGNLEYLGREDFQVKIRGLRIELGEIESVLRNHHSVKDCIVVVKHYTETVVLIIAYVVLVDSLIQDELDQYLSEFLPEYMLPNHYEKLNEIPLTSNGKADRKALPEPKLEVGK